MNDICFIMALKNRRQRAIDSVASIACRKVDLCIVQELDVDNLQQSDVPHVKLINLQTGGFNKSKLLNHGIRNTKQPIVVQWDADILWSSVFTKALLVLEEKDFKHHFYVCPYVETNDMIDPVTHINAKPRKTGDLVSHTIIASRFHLEGVRGWDERINIYCEEYDLMNRLHGAYDISPIDMGKLNLRNLHMTHENTIRVPFYGPELEEYNARITKQNMVEKKWVVNDEKWGLM
jgi:glycosyltransferase involved in cell wall biosynthesis